MHCVVKRQQLQRQKQSKRLIMFLCSVLCQTAMGLGNEVGCVRATVSCMVNQNHCVQTLSWV
jgi:hypothetical protein